MYDENTHPASFLSSLREAALQQHMGQPHQQGLKRVYGVSLLDNKKRTKYNII